MHRRIRNFSCRTKDAWYIGILVFICTIPYLSISFLVPAMTNQEVRKTTPFEHFGVDQAHVLICAEGKSSNKLVDCSSHVGSNENRFIGSVDIVISHYEHSLVGLFKSILAAVSTKARPLRIWVYSKGSLVEEEQEDLKRLVSHIGGVSLYFQLNMKNVGRCDHTYLHHIQHHYNDLGDFTVFLKDTTPWHLHLDEMSNTLSMLTFKVPHNLQVWCPRELIVEKTSFQLKKYQSEQCSRFGNCYRNETYIRSSITPLGDWMSAMNILSSAHSGLGSRLDGDDLGLRGWKIRVVPVCYGGVFGATSGAIRHTSKESYARLERELSVGDSIEVGHYMERSWLSSFGVWSVGTMEYRNRLAVLVVGDIPTCALRAPTRFVNSDVFVQFFIVTQKDSVESNSVISHRNREQGKYNDSNVSSSGIGANRLLEKGSGWHLLHTSNKEAIYAPHQIKELSNFDYTLVFFSNGDSQNPVSLSTELTKREFSICTITTADVRVAIGRSLVNGASIALPRHVHNLNFELGVVLRRMTESAEMFGADWLLATQQVLDLKKPLDALEWARSQHPSEWVGPLMVDEGAVTTHDHTTFWGPLATRRS